MTGLEHPWSGLDHVLAMIAVGLWGAQLGNPALWLLPVTFPLVMSLGFDPIWFGVIITALAEIGLITPPVGLNCFIVSQVSKLPLEEVFKGASILLIAELIVVALMMYFPEITLWLPSMMD